IRHWVTGSAHPHRSICLVAVATMTSVAAGKWPLQARHMLLMGTPTPPKGWQPLFSPRRITTNRRRVNNVWAAPESRQRFFRALLRGE
ncbi:hypothetical protein KR084_005897, partial [Drosophila pseudotakahashii]